MKYLFFFLTLCAGVIYSQSHFGGAVTSDRVVNSSNVTGATLTDALNNIETGKADIDLVEGHLLIGDATNVATDTAVSGDIAITAGGVTTIQPGAVNLSTDTVGDIYLLNTGDTLDGNLGITGNITNSTGNVTINDNLDVTGNITGTLAEDSVDATMIDWGEVGNQVNDSVIPSKTSVGETVEEALNELDNLAGEALGDAADALAMDLADVTANGATTATNLDLQGNITNSTGNVTINDNLDAQGNITNSTGNVTIDDNLDVTGNLTVTIQDDNKITVSPAINGRDYLHDILQVTFEIADGAREDANDAIDKADYAINDAADAVDTANDALAMELSDITANGNLTTDALDLQGNITNTAGNVTIDDNLDITGNITGNITLSADSVDATMIDWGEVGNQVNDGIIPTATSINGATTVEGALNELESLANDAQSTADDALSDAQYALGDAADALGDAADALAMDLADITANGATTATNLDLQGNITNTVGNVTIDDNLDVTGDLDVDVIRNNSGNVIIDDDLEIEGSVYSGSTGYITFDTGTKFYDDMEIFGFVDITGNITNSTGNVTIDDSLDVSGVATSDRDEAGNLINLNGFGELLILQSDSATNPVQIGFKDDTASTRYQIAFNETDDDLEFYSAALGDDFLKYDSSVNSIILHSNLIGDLKSGTFTADDEPVPVVCENHGLTTGDYILIYETTTEEVPVGVQEVTVTDSGNFTLDINNTPTAGSINFTTSVGERFVHSFPYATSDGNFYSATDFNFYNSQGNGNARLNVVGKNFGNAQLKVVDGQYDDTYINIKADVQKITFIMGANDRVEDWIVDPNGANVNIQFWDDDDAAWFNYDAANETLDIFNNCTITEAGISAEDVQIVDSGSHITATNVEDALQELANNQAYMCIGTKNNTTATNITVTDTWYTVTTFDATASANNNCTANLTAGTIEADIAGDFKIAFSISVEVGGADAFIFAIFVNGSTETYAYSKREIPINDIGSMSGSCLVNLSANDTVELKVKNSTGTHNITVTDGTLNISKVGN